MRSRITEEARAVSQGRSERTVAPTGSRWILGVQSEQEVEVLIATTDGVVEMEEMQGVIAEGQERGFVASRRSRRRSRRPS